RCARKHRSSVVSICCSGRSRRAEPRPTRRRRSSAPGTRPPACAMMATIQKSRGHSTWCWQRHGSGMSGSTREAKPAIGGRSKMNVGPPFAIGFGYDTHRLAPARRLVLGGVDIPHDRGLEGHSDADVLLHAVMDALLGAAGLQDIGHFFPNTDARWKDADSRALLRVVADRLTEDGWRIGNVDSVLVAEEPRVAPHPEAM